MSSSITYYLHTQKPHLEKTIGNIDFWDEFGQKCNAGLSGNTTHHEELSKLSGKSVHTDKQRWTDDKATTGEAALMTGTVEDAFQYFERLGAAAPQISSPILDENGILQSAQAQKAVY